MIRVPNPLGVNRARPMGSNFNDLNPKPGITALENGRMKENKYLYSKQDRTPGISSSTKYLFRPSPNKEKSQTTEQSSIRQGKSSAAANTTKLLTDTVERSTELISSHSESVVRSLPTNEEKMKSAGRFIWLAHRLGGKKFRCKQIISYTP